MSGKFPASAVCRRFPTSHRRACRVARHHGLRQPAAAFRYAACCDRWVANDGRAFRRWGRVVRPDASRLAGKSGSRLPQSKALGDVSQRVTQTLKWVTGGKLGLLTIARDHLTLGRAALYAAILGESEISNLKSEIDRAVSSLHRAGSQHHIPRGLLTRAWLRSLTGNRTGPESAQSDLDEAWGIAERGPMQLFLVDIHLYRARLFGRMKDEGGMMNEANSYPWGSVEEDLKEARRLIEKCGYWRRKEELEDAEGAFRR